MTLRLGGNGAAVPFSITNVRLLWDGGTKTVPFVKSRETLPSITTKFSIQAPDRLVGRWEIVKPGDTLPTNRDSLPEASLPVEERGTQKRYTQVKRFNTFLAPVGRTVIPGPDNQQIEKIVEGMYLLLFRVESVTDGLNQSNLQAVNAGSGTRQQRRRFRLCDAYAAILRRYRRLAGGPIQRHRLSTGTR